MKQNNLMAIAKNGIFLNIIIMIVLVAILFVWYYGNVLKEHASDISVTQEKAEIYNNIHTKGFHDFKSDVDFETARGLKAQMFNRLLPGFSYLIRGEDLADTREKTDLILNIIEKPAEFQGPYLEWLESSFVDEGVGEYVVEQTREIGEVIPTFVDHDPDSNTSDIGSKVTLKSIINYVQSDLFGNFGVEVVEGTIGIENISFDERVPTIGYYDIVIKIPRFDKYDLINLLDFVYKTGDIALVQVDNGDKKEIRHISPHEGRERSKARSQQIGNSALSNLLLTIEQLSIIPAQPESEKDETGNEIDPAFEGESYMTLQQIEGLQEWIVDFRLRFYIRGASGAQVRIIEDQIDLLLDGFRSLTPGADKSDDEKESELFTVDNPNHSLRDRIEKQFSLCTQKECNPRQIEQVEKMSDLLRSLQSIESNYREASSGPSQEESFDTELDDIKYMQARIKTLQLLQSIEKKLLEAVEEINK